MAADMAVRSFQLIVEQEPHAGDGPRHRRHREMAVWMAQFYSIIPYTPAEIDADAKLPGTKRNSCSCAAMKSASTAAARR